MIRKLMLPALAIALLGGCATSAYQYRGGQGDYYYGQPSTQYRYYNSPYGYYGSPYGYYSPYGYSGYGYGYYGYGGGFGYPYLPQRRHYRGDGHDHGHGGRDHGDRDGDRDGGNHHGDRDRNGDPPGHGQPGNDGQPARPDRGPGFRPGPAWRDPGNLGASPADRPYRAPATTHPRPATPAARSSSGGSVGSRASGDTTGSTSTDRKRRRIQEP